MDRGNLLNRRFKGGGISKEEGRHDAGNMPSLGILLLVDIATCWALVSARMFFWSVTRPRLRKSPGADD